MTLAELVSEYEKNLIIDMLIKTNGNQKLAAEKLGASRRNLIYKIKRYEITIKKDPLSIY